MRGGKISQERTKLMPLFYDIDHNGKQSNDALRSPAEYERRLTAAPSPSGIAAFVVATALLCAAVLHVHIRDEVSAFVLPSTAMAHKTGAVHLVDLRECVENSPFHARRC
jgi:hypothetical protein